MSKRSITITVIFLLLLATALRFHKLEAQSFWNDEGNSARLSERSLPLIIEGTASDIHPPLYYLLLRGWRELVGETEFGLRSLSAFAGVLLVAVTLRLGKFISHKPTVWLMAGGLTAVSPPLIYYSQETRMYMLLPLLATLSTLLLLVYLERTRPSKRLGKPSRNRLSGMDHGLRVTDYGLLTAYTLTLTAGLYTHYIFPLLFLIHATQLTIHNSQFTIHNLMQGERGKTSGRNPRPGGIGNPRSSRPYDLSYIVYRLSFLIPPFLAMLAALLLYLPWLPIFLRQAGGRPAVRAPIGRFLADALRWLTVGETLPSQQAPWLIFVILGLLIISIWAAGRKAVFALLGLLLPLLFIYAVGITQPEFYKFMGLAVPPFALLLTAWLHQLDQHPPLLIAGALLIVMLNISSYALDNLYNNPAFARADYRGMANAIAEANHPNAGIILNAPNQWEVFTYYHTDGEPVYPIPMGQPRADLIVPQLEDIAATHERIYVLFWGEAQRDPERLVERWLDENAFKATDDWVGDVRFVTYAVPDAPATEMETAVSTQFGDHITLQGYTFSDTTLQPNDILQVTLFWETAVSLDTRYKIFLQLLNSDGTCCLAQRDSEPGGGLNLTTVWEPNQPILDNHGLLIPAAAPPGTYTLLLGLYDVSDPAQRLPIASEEALSDALPVTVIRIP